jgi:hypothetical protein
MNLHFEHGSGRIRITLRAAKLLSPNDVEAALRRTSQEHDLDGGAHQKTKQTLNRECKLLCAFRSSNGLPFWIISEPGGSLLTVLLPEDYGPRPPVPGFP